MHEPERAELAEPSTSASEAAETRAAPSARAAREELTPDPLTPTEPASRSAEATPERVLEVLVRDVHGRPVPDIVLELDLETIPRSSGPNTPLAPTDVRGLTEVPLEAFTAPNWEVERHWFVLRARVPHPDPIWIDLGSRPTPGFVSLTLPLAGAVRVTVVDRDGDSVGDGASVYAIVRGGGTSEARVEAEVRDGSAEFPWIPIDTSLELRASYHDQRASSERLTLRGPSYPGETVESELRLGCAWPVLRFRVLDERREPLASTGVWLRVSLPPLSPQIARVTTSKAGGVELELLARHESVRERLLEIVTERSPGRSGELALPAELAREAPTELGDVVLRPGPGWR